jgi:hypothetical protein
MSTDHSKFMFDARATNWPLWKERFLGALEDPTAPAGTMTIRTNVVKIINGTLKLSTDKEAFEPANKYLFILINQHIDAVTRGITTAPYGEGYLLYTQLANKFEVTSTPQKMALLNQLSTQTPAKDFAEVPDKVNKICSIVSQLNNIAKMKIEDSIAINALTTILPPADDYHRERLFTFEKLEDACTYLIQVAQARPSSAPRESAYAVTFPGAQQYCSKCGQPHSASSCSMPQPFVGFCYVCGRKGHRGEEHRDFSGRGRENGRGQRYGRGRGRSRGRGSNNNNYNFNKHGGKSEQKTDSSTQEKKKPVQSNAVFVPSDDDLSELSTAVHDHANTTSLLDTDDSNGTLWLVDSGATTHISNNRNDFYALDETVTCPVTVADNKTIYSHGEGKIRVTVHDAHNNVVKFTFTAKYVPDIHTRLYSPAEARIHGVTYNNEIPALKLKDGTIVPLLTHNKVDIARFSIVHPTVEEINTVHVNKEILHARTGHFQFRHVKEIAKRGQVTGLPKTHGDLEHKCEACETGKAHKLPINKLPAQRATKIGEVIHTDIWGPSTVTSPSGSRYAIIFVDDYSRYRRVYFLRTRDQALDAFRQYLSLIKTTSKTTLEVERLHTDNAGEYKSAAFTEFCESRGVRLSYSSPHTPSQNGIAERSWRIIVESARTMMLAMGVAKKYWTSAFSTAAYISNRVLIVRDPNKTPHELWTGKPPDLTHLRVFGCTAYVYDERQSVTKFDPKARKGMMLGYSEDSPAYIVLVEGRLITSRNVTFDEKRRFTSKPDSDNNIPLDFLDQQQNIQNNDVSPHIPSMPIMVTPIPAVVTSTPPAFAQQPVIATDIYPNTPSAEATVDQPIPSPALPAPVSQTQTPIANNSNTTSISENSQQQLKANKATKSKTTEHTLAYHRERRPNAGINPRLHNVNLVKHKVSNTAELVLACSTTLMAEDEPQSFKQAMKAVNADKWRQAIKQELNSLEKKQTFKIISKPQVWANIVKCKWIFKVKRGPDGNITRYKARLVAQGYTQKYGVDFTDTFAPVAKYSTLRTLIAIAAAKNYELEHSDVSTAYLNADLKETILMEVPEGLREKYDDKTHVIHLKKSLYGLKQSGRNWHEHLVDFLLKLGLTQSAVDPCLFTRKGADNNYFAVLVYVDDLVYCGDKESVDMFKTKIARNYEVTHEGSLKWILGIGVHRDRNKGIIRLTQMVAINKILKVFDMIECRPLSTPLTPGQRLSKADCPITAEDKEIMSQFPYKSLIGSLIYLSIATRPDISFAVGVLSRYASNPGKAHWNAAINVIRYLKGTQDIGLQFNQGQSELTGYSDSDWRGDEDERKSTSAYIFLFSGGPISWRSKLQKYSAISSTEAEYTALCPAVQEAIFLRNILHNFHIDTPQPTTIFEDNQGAICQSKDPVNNSRMKHIDVKLHFTRQMMKAGFVHVTYIATQDMRADMLTKAMSRKMFEKHRQLLMAPNI